MLTINKPLKGGINMDTAFKMLSDIIGKLTSVIIALLGLGIVGNLLFGEFLGLDVVGNITALVSDLANGGVVGLLVIAILLMLLGKK